jgi:hypothetical protein
MSAAHYSKNLGQIKQGEKKELISPLAASLSNARRLAAEVGKPE